MANKKDKKVYTLTIEHIEGEDACEFIKEEIVNESDSKPSWAYGELDLEDYFSDSDLSGLICCTVGKT